MPKMFLPILIGILSMVNSALALIPEDGVSVEAVDSWLERNALNLPSDYGTFVQHNRTYRNAIYLKLDNRAQSNLWVSHWDGYTSKHPDLSLEKLAFLQEMKDISASPELNDEQVHGLEERAKDIFTKDEGRALFVHLGMDDPRVASNDEREHELSRRQGLHSRCDCSLTAWFTCFMGCSATPACIKPAQPGGCGFWWKQDCDGVCSTFGSWDR